MTRDLKEKRDDLREESPYKCSLCDRAFPDRAELEEHHGSAHREQQSI